MANNGLAPLLTIRSIGEHGIKMFSVIYKYIKWVHIFLVGESVEHKRLNKHFIELFMNTDALSISISPFNISLWVGCARLLAHIHYGTMVIMAPWLLWQLWHNG